MKVTIKDIARETGLSTATVSKYLNHIKIQEDNRQSIEEAIERLGYHPNRSAQILRSKKTRTIGILTSYLGNYFWGPVIGAISHYFTSHQYTVITCSYYFDHTKELDIIQDIISQNFEGIIMLPMDKNDNSYTLLQKANIPVVVLDQYPDSMNTYPVDCVLSDNYGGSALLAEHLYQNGHTNVRILGNALHSYTINTRIQAFLDTYEKYGIDTQNIICSDDAITFREPEDFSKYTEQLLLQILNAPNPPTAIFFTNYMATMGGLSALTESGYNIPDSLSLVSFDYDTLFRAMPVPLTCISQNLTSLGLKASELLMSRISNNYNQFPETYFIDTLFYPGNSVCNLNHPI